MVAIAPPTNGHRRSAGEQLRVLSSALRASAQNLLVRPAPPGVPSTTRSTVRASATRLNIKDRKVATAESKRAEEWQNEAWAYFDDVPELKYSIWFEGNVMAKCRWYVGVRDPDNPDAQPTPVSDPRANIDSGLAARAQAELARLKGPLGGITEIVRELNMNLEIAAEAYLIGFGPKTIPATPVSEEKILPEEWGLYSISEVMVESGRYSVKTSPSDKNPRKLDPDNDAIIRIWQRHPRWSMMADCNMRGVLNECEALVILTNLVKAEAKSLMNAGYVTLPNELTPGSAIETEPEDGAESQVDPFVEDLIDGATEPVEDPSSAAAVAPIFIRGPGDWLKPDFVRQVEIKRQMTAVLDERIQKRVERIARGLNLPVEVVMGHQQTTFANAAQVKLSEFDEHFQPRCVLIADALSVAFLLPQLAEDYGPDETENLVVWFDPSAMIKQVDPFDSADYGLEHGAISLEAWRREKGWSEDDAASELERIQALLLLHSRTLDPGVSTAIMRSFGVELDIPDALPSSGTAADAKIAAAAVPAQVRLNGLLAELADLVGPDAMEPVLAALRDRAKVAASEASGKRPTHTHNPGYQLMLLDRDLRSRLTVAADRVMSRVLERAGNRLRAKAGVNRELVRTVHPMYVAQHLGKSLVASAGFADDDLIGADAWDTLEKQFFTWGAQAQQQAMSTVDAVIGMSTAERDALGARQATDLTESWSWLRDQLHDLASARLYSPDPAAPDVGEFDPTSKVPTGMIRQALARAGGATSIESKGGGEVFVALNNDAPLGGIGTGEAVMGALSDGGGLIEAWEWVYGPAFRLHPYEDHEVLDGTIFESFDDDVLTGSPFDATYYPGDHDGCACDVAPILVPPDVIDANSNE